MRILFVFKSVEWLGIEYLSSSLTAAGHATELAFEAGLEGTFYFGRGRDRRHGKVLEMIGEFRPDLICFSCTTNLFPWVRETAARIKERFSGIPVLVGGIHPTIQPDRVLSDSSVDMICRGEAEEALVELANRMDSGTDYLDTRNFWFKHDGEIHRNDLRAPVADLDTLAFPDKDLFHSYGCFRRRAYVMTGRGCPYDCSYCFNHQMRDLYQPHHCSYVRRRTVGSVIRELESYRERYGITSVHFYDDTFIVNKRWVLEFCNAYRQAIHLPFYCLVRANLVDDEIMGALKDAGCSCVGMGLESGNDTIRNEVLKRNMSREQIVTAAKIIHRNRIKLVTFNMFGMPGETPQQMLETVKLNLEIRPQSLFTYIFFPFPGTRLAGTAADAGYVDATVMNQMLNGDGNYQSESILNMPCRTEAYNLKVILPLLNHLPRVMHRLFTGSWIGKEHSRVLMQFVKIVSIPLYSSWESGERFMEQVSMLKVSLFGRRPVKRLR